MRWSQLRRKLFGHPSKEDITCPAAELIKPVLSPHPFDINCNVNGRVRAAKDSPCCGDYWNCRVWQINKIQEQNIKEANSGLLGSTARRIKGKHVLSNSKRDKI